MTQITQAKSGVESPELKAVAAFEKVESPFLLQELISGRLVIPTNHVHLKQGLKPAAIGSGVTCKINANIGTSSEDSSLEKELEKVTACLKYGADTIMDLSTGGNIRRIRQAILERCSIPLGTVPIYEILERAGNIEDIRPKTILEVIEEQAAEGVDYMTVHVGVLNRMVPKIRNRLTGIVSRGGAILAAWMRHHQKENPFYELFNEILEICRSYDVTLSLGDGMRPGCLADASDEAQFEELRVLGELHEKCLERDVQSMIEGPGHIPYHQIAMNVQKEIELCGGAPFYVLGPLVIDIAPGYDHITSAIGATAAAVAGAAMICYVTPKEHLGLPDCEDVRQGIIACKIAAHAADIARGRPGARDRDDAMARARFAFDWEKQFRLALDGDRAREYFCRASGRNPSADDQSKFCSMCGPKFCPMALSSRIKG